MRDVSKRFEVTLVTRVEVDADDETAAIEAAAQYVFENDVVFDTARAVFVGWGYVDSLEVDPDGRRSRNMADEVLGDL